MNWDDEDTSIVDTDEGEDIPEGQDEGIWYRSQCPHCEEVNEGEDDSRGQVVECTSCGGKYRHHG